MGWSGSMTSRQFLVWQEWLHQEWNIPSRDNWYVMELIASVKRMFAEKPESITAESQKRLFEWKLPPTEEELEEAEKKATQDAIAKGIAAKKMHMSRHGIKLDKDGKQIISSKPVVTPRRKQRPR